MRAITRLPFILLSLFGAEHDTASANTGRMPSDLKPIRAALLATLVDQVLTGKTPHAPLRQFLRRRRLQTFRGNKILLVEDNPVNQRVAQRTLQNLSAEVIIANNGAEALERIAATAFDAVLMDCQMPVMDGFTATRRIRDLERQPRRETAADHRAHRECHERGSRKMHCRRHGCAPRQTDRSRRK